VNPKAILVVEDSDLLHRMYDLVFLEAHAGGTRIVHAFNGQDALQKLHENPECGLIILDINMPVMSGLDFLERIKRETAFRDIPVIIVSTEGSEEDTLRGLEAGAAAYIKKPFEPFELENLVRQVLGTK
jgi:two-component system, chemotaxis family, chemotaxis protein CheY